jgi:anti-sigma B factor antagonist
MWLGSRLDMGIRGGGAESPRSVHEHRLVVSNHKEGDSRTIRAVGELDIATAPVLEKWLRQAFEHHAGPIILDLTEIGFVDRAGWRVLTSAAIRSRESGDRLRIRVGTGGVTRMIEATTVGSRHLA